MNDVISQSTQGTKAGDTKYGIPSGPSEKSETGGGVISPMKAITTPSTVSAPTGEGKKLDITAHVADSFSSDWKKATDAVGDYIGGLSKKFQDIFKTISKTVELVSTGFSDDWKQAVQQVGSIMQSVMGVIGSLVNDSFDSQKDKMNAYYSAQEEQINNSSMSEQAKSKALTKLHKEEEKERKKIAREQAKDQKEMNLVSAVIAGAMAVVGALAATPGPAGIVMAVIVGALAALEIAAIASQPLPSLAEGGLAFAPTMAMVGDNPNASVDPEVIGPLSKIKQMIGGNQQEVKVTGMISGENILLSSDRSTRLRDRIY